MKRLLSIMLVLMLVLSMTATAFATETEPGQTKADETKATEIKVIKTYNDPVGYGAKFFFKVTQTEPDPMSGANVAPTLEIAPFSFPANHPNPVETAEALVQITNFKAEGIFKYTVTETQIWGAADDITAPHAAPDLKGGQMDMSQAEYEVTVSVKNTGKEYAIESVVAQQLKDDNGDAPTGDGKASALAFVNTYAKEAGTPTDPDTGSLIISKKVVNALNAADETAFSFTVNYTYPAGGNPFMADVSAPATLHDTPTGGTATFTLKNGESVVFTGLPIGTVVNVEETGVPSYKPSAVVSMGAGTVDSNITGLNFGESLTLATLTEDQRTLLAEKNAVDVTNTYNYVAPTGVILNVLPYVLMVAIAGGMIVLFTAMKRRKAQDNNED